MQSVDCHNGSGQVVRVVNKVMRIHHQGAINVQTFEAIHFEEVEVEIFQSVLLQWIK